MWLINVNTLKLEYHQGRNIPEYAILSHRWEQDEVSFEDWLMGNVYVSSLDGSVNYKQGYMKTARVCELARERAFNYVWVDMCCIDKRSSAELSEAINSMFRWYQKAQVCFAFLSDISLDPESHSQFTTSAWFTRGWTLQELLAPVKLVFFDQNWVEIGSRDDGRLSWPITLRTRIPSAALKKFKPEEYSIAARMSWAALRGTTREEDRAYSLLGIFGIYMPMLYGEGEAAFQRLQEEIVRQSDDRSIFIWSERGNPSFGVFAADPDCFLDSARFSMIDVLPNPTQHESPSGGYTITDAGLSIQLSLQPISRNAYIAWLGASNPKREMFAIYVSKVPTGKNNYRRMMNCEGNMYRMYATETYFKISSATRPMLITLVRKAVHKPFDSFEFVPEYTTSRFWYDNTVRDLNNHVMTDTSQSSPRTVKIYDEETSFFATICAQSQSRNLYFMTVGTDASGSPFFILDIWPDSQLHVARHQFGSDSLTANQWSKIAYEKLLYVTKELDGLGERPDCVEVSEEFTGRAVMIFSAGEILKSKVQHKWRKFQVFRTASGFAIYETETDGELEESNQIITDAKYSWWTCEHNVTKSTYHANLLDQLESILSQKLAYGRAL